jgi:hypothetical protein
VRVEGEEGRGGGSESRGERRVGGWEEEGRGVRGRKEGWGVGYNKRMGGGERREIHSSHSLPSSFPLPLPLRRRGKESRKKGESSTYLWMFPVKS